MSSIPGAGWSNSVFKVGRGLAIPLSVHEVARKKLVDILKSKGIISGIVLLKGGDESSFALYDTDAEGLFKQDSWFTYLFGVKEPGFYGAINLSDSQSILFMPKLSAEYAIWCGEILPPSHFQAHYNVTSVRYTEELNDFLTSTLQKEGNNAQIHILEGLNTDSGTYLKAFNFDNSELFEANNQINKTQLFHALSTGRVTKSNEEIEILRYVNYIASIAHVEVMRIVKEGLYEYDLEAKFLYEIYRQGSCRTAAYTSICACGPNGAVLHYGHSAAPNDRELLSTDMALLDMGAVYHGYCSDITCSSPVSGKFSSQQRAIYECVLAAQTIVMKTAKPGVSWALCHHLAQIEILKGLLSIGLLKGKTAEELADLGIGGIFFSHGLGHLIGCDTHDVGG